MVLQLFFWGEHLTLDVFFFWKMQESLISLYYRDERGEGPQQDPHSWGPNMSKAITQPYGLNT